MRDALPERLQIAGWAVRRYRWKFGRWPNLIRPQELNELIALSKIFNRDPRIVRLADKLLVKDYVREKLGDDWVIPTLWSGERLPPRDQRTWPLPFVIKANNGSGWNLFVREEQSCDWEEIEARCDTWMSSIYGRELGEWHYARMPARLMVEPFINFNRDLPIDIKFLVFHGRVEFIYVVIGRETNERHAFFDRNWNRVPYGQGFPTEPGPVAPPAALAEMIRGAEILAADFPFVRVDLYEVNGRPLVGELTFYPGSGLNHFNPPEFNRQLVALWRKKRRPTPQERTAVVTT